MPGKSAVTTIDCDRVRDELSNYLEADLPLQLRLRIDKHLQDCDRCAAVYDGVRNVLRLLGDARVIELPEGFSRRLRQRLPFGGN